MTEWQSLKIGHGLASDAHVVFAEPGGRWIGDEALRVRAEAAMHAAKFQGHGAAWLDIIGGNQAERIILIRLDPAGQSGPKSWLAAAGTMVEAMQALRIGSVRLPAESVFAAAGTLRALLVGALLHGYHLDQRRRGASPVFRPTCLVVDESDQAEATDAIRIAQAINRARAWVEQPANLLTPAIFAHEAAEALEACGATVRTFDLAEIERLGAGALLAVAQGSVHEPRLLVAEWRGAPDREGWDAALVGKGITFDAGGLNIKSRPLIEKMKFDMGGAAAVLGAMELAVSRKAGMNLVAVVPMAENVIGSAGMKPGDVIRSMSGLTVEIINTDAEGRLVLADGITYVIANYNPAAVVDVATLTGAITGVLHEEFAGFYASDDRLAEELQNAGEETDELLWRMPLSPSQDYLVASEVADVANLGAPGFLGLGIGSPAAGAKFIQKFVGDTPWAHIDIAGTAWATRKTARSQPGATGFGVALLDEWLSNLERRS